MHRDQDLTAPNQLSNMSTHQINSDQLENNTKMETNQEYYHLGQ